MTTPRFALLAGCIAGAFGVVLGAFGAHALRGVLDGDALGVWRTAVDYEFWHALALLAVAAAARARPTRALTIAAVAFALGTVLFCASLYALALGAPRAFGLVTPFGGVALLAGWLAFAVHAARAAKPQ
ncbi:MAG TPA: DUF423 domain-containing protein [Dokdonella sp.]